MTGTQTPTLIFLQLYTSLSIKTAAPCQLELPTNFEELRPTVKRNVVTSHQHWISSLFNHTTHHGLYKPVSRLYGKAQSRNDLETNITKHNTQVPGAINSGATDPKCIRTTLRPKEEGEEEEAIQELQSGQAR